MRFFAQGSQTLHSASPPIEANVPWLDVRKGGARESHARSRTQRKDPAQRSRPRSDSHRVESQAIHRVDGVDAIDRLPVALEGILPAEACFAVVKELDRDSALDGRADESCRCGRRQDVSSPRSALSRGSCLDCGYSPSPFGMHLTSRSMYFKLLSLVYSGCRLASSSASSLPSALAARSAAPIFSRL